MSNANKIQLRGHCQCCCGLQAVLQGSKHRMSKHGYEVKDRGNYGWFQGVCSGHNYAPVEEDRSVLDNVVVQIREQAAELRERAEQFESGKAHPRNIRTNRYDTKTRTFISKPWEEGTTYEQRYELERAIRELRQRAGAGDSQANMMMQVAANYHGKPLVEIIKSAGPAPVLVGEKKISARGIMTARHIERGMVHWSLPQEDGKVLRSRMSTRSWRMMQDAE